MSYQKYLYYVGGTEDGTRACACEASSPVSFASISEIELGNWVRLDPGGNLSTQRAVEPLHVLLDDSVQMPARGTTLCRLSSQEVLQGHCLVQSLHTLQVRKPKSFLEANCEVDRWKSFTLAELLAALPKPQYRAFTRTERCGQASHFTFVFLELNFSTIWWSFSLDIYIQPFWQRKVWVLLKYWHCVTKRTRPSFHY